MPFGRPPAPGSRVTHRSSALLAFTILAVVGCGGASTADASITVDTLPGGIVRTLSQRPIDAGRWSLVHARDLQPGETDPAELLDPRDLALADDGSLLVVDTKPERIKVFDRAGTFVRAIGGEGDGPGEYRVAYIAIRGDTLVLQDPRNSRATTFDWRTGALVRDRRTACCYWSPIAIDRDGWGYARSILNSPDTTERNNLAYVRFAIGGTAVDTVYAVERQGTPAQQSWVVRDGKTVRMATLVPLQPRAIFGIEPGGAHLTGWNGEYLLRTSRDGRDTVALFGRAAAPVPVDPALRSRLTEAKVAEILKADPIGSSEQALRLAFDPAMIPDRFPAYENFSTDGEGRRWVRLVGPDTTRVAFDVFDAQGRWLDSVSVAARDWPAEWWRPVAWSRREVAVILEGEDGRPLVRVFSIVRR